MPNLKKKNDTIRLTDNLEQHSIDQLSVELNNLLKMI
jgi:hypothetical protein